MLKGVGMAVPKNHRN